MKRMVRLIIRRFSGFISLFILGAMAYIFSGNLGGLFKWIWSFNWLVFPLAIMIILIPFWPTIKGAFGEFLVRKKLFKFDPAKYKILNNVFLKLSDGKTAQIDHVVISVFGIFVIETKNYSGWISGDEKSEYWTQSFFRSKKRFLNPIWQNSGHIKALKEVLNGFNDILYIPVVVFSNKANLKRVLSGKVTSIKDLSGYIDSWQERVMDENTVEEVNSRLQEAMIRDKQEVKNHIAGIRNEVEKKAHICPKCGKPLVQRNGRYGFFIGCSGYPRCRYIYRGK